MPDRADVKAKTLKKVGELRKNWKNKFTTAEKKKGDSIYDEYDHLDPDSLTTWREHKSTQAFQVLF